MAHADTPERHDNVNPSQDPAGSHHGPPPEDAPVDFGVWLARNAFTLVLMVGAFGWMYHYFGAEGLLSVVKAALALSFVVFIHELGHFVVAKWCDVHVETFSIGFGPALPGCSFQRGETFYKIALFPLGGYVKMVGEGTEEEDDDDPRSFKNKTVGQRMAIISAGVVMNVLLAAGCFVFAYMVRGVERPPGAIGMVEAGSPTWKKGIPSGSVIHQIGDVRKPYFDDLMPEVMNSTEGQSLPFVYSTADEPEKIHRTFIEPRREKSDKRPVIGVVPIEELKLFPKERGLFMPPVAQTSSAAQAQPPFDYGDTIVGMTDPDKPRETTLLPLDPRDPENKKPDVLEFQRRCDRLAGKPMTILVRRAGQDEHSAPVAIKVPASFHYSLGIRMRMGQVAALRDDSPAAKAGVRAKDPASDAEGDIIKQVEVVEPDGKKTRWVSSRSKEAPAGVVERDLDPVKLGDELQQWADRTPKDRKVTLTVLRKVGHEERREAKLVLDWDNRWRHDREVPFNKLSPQPIPGLGLAYRVDTVVEEVAPDSPAQKAGLKKGDFIKGIRFTLPGKTPVAPVTDGPWQDLAGDEWAHPSWALRHYASSKEVTLKVERDGQTMDVRLAAEPDPTWPSAELGLFLMPERRLHKAENPQEALMIGLQRTTNSIRTIYMNLRAMVTGRVSPKLLSGPIGIAQMAYYSAGAGLIELVVFMGMISVNLAVINFLPIPVLDGGHMVFLIYEKLRGQPASEQVRAAATYTGLMLIVSLMLFVIFLDVTR